MIVLKVSNNTQMLLKHWSLRGSCLAAPAGPDREIYGRPQLKVLINASYCECCHSWMFNIDLHFKVKWHNIWSSSTQGNELIHCHILECYLKIWLHSKYMNAGKSRNPPFRLLTLLTHHTIHSCIVTIQCQLLGLLRHWSAVQDRTEADAEDPIPSAD